jgi:hypothetical protein
MNTQRFAIAIAWMPRIERAIATTPRFAESNRDVPRDLQMQSRCTPRLANAIAMDGVSRKIDRQKCQSIVMTMMATSAKSMVMMITYDYG